MDVPPPQASLPTQTRAAMQPEKPDGVRANVIEILSDTANGILSELGYYPGIIRQSRAEIDELRKRCASLWEDNRRLAQLLDVARERLATYASTDEDRIERILAYKSEGEALRVEKDALTRTLISANPDDRMHHLLREIDAITHKYQIALTDIALLRSNHIKVTTQPGNEATVGSRPPSASAVVAASGALSQEKHVNPVPVAVPVRRVSHGMARHNTPQPHPQMIVPPQIPSFVSVPAQYGYQHAGYIVPQPGPSMHQSGPQPTGHGDAPPGQAMLRPGHPLSMPPHQAAGPHPPTNPQPVLYHQAQRPAPQYHTPHPAHQRPIMQYTLNNPGTVHPHGQPVPHPAVHYASGPNQPLISHRRVSRHAYPMTPSTPSMNFMENDMQLPLTPTSARTGDFPAKNVVLLPGVIRRREVEVVDLTGGEEPESKRPRLEETGTEPQPQLAGDVSTASPAAEAEKTNSKESEAMTVDAEGDVLTSPQEDGDNTLPLEECVASIFVDVEKGNSEKGRLCYLCKYRYETKADPHPPKVFINPTIDEQVEHAKIVHPPVWDHFRENGVPMTPAK
ncbi:hypothetical protein NEOLEDRAFT_585541 [Neolentinus lepideus HHB14362 ss-1]|uniref:Uncharacterized protein n=1 Tax=Neolentinus lepideus HHB14362 ss-1 TaxID=1314782 RepID=A0A165V6V5_9AGAM|nr:hypothetical protein NEOLEDRAFT_585541 [Neolentinus lepideus HHB14362 ss-1]